MAIELDSTSLKSEFERLADLINLPLDRYPKFKMPPEPIYDDEDYIVIEDSHYMFYRGEPMGVFLYIKTDSLDELFYFVFECLTHDVAESMSINEYGSKVEVRRFIWPKQLTLMKKLSQIWSHRLATTILEILASHPPRDGMGDIAKQIQLETYLQSNN